MRRLKRSFRFAMEAFDAFLRDDGWAIASHIALSMLMSLFPFLIFVTALGGFLFGSKNLADQVADLLLEAWPPEVAGPLASEIASVLNNAHGSILTFGAVLALYFSSAGIESLRIGLNRAYGESEKRAWWVLRLESIGYVLVGAIALVSLAFLIVLAPLTMRTVLRFVPGLVGLEQIFTFVRFGIAMTVIVVALVMVHKWLPFGRRRLIEIAPGVITTIVLWIVMGAAFGRYLSQFAATYVSTYAGLASAMVALVFLYWTAGIFVYGGELNNVIRRARIRRKAEREQKVPERAGAPNIGAPMAPDLPAENRKRSFM